jgi:hypothetical protein
MALNVERSWVMHKSPVRWLVGPWVMVALLLLLSGPALAVPITIINPSFEDVSGNDGLGGWSTHSILLTQRGIVAAADSFNNYTSPYGPMVAFVNQGGDLYQRLSTPIAANTTYILTVYVGHPGDPDASPQPTPHPFAYSVQLGFWSLESGGFYTYDVLKQESGSNGIAPLFPGAFGYDPGIGKFGLLTLSYTSDQSHVGQGLEILFKAFAVSDVVNFDMVTLDAVPVLPTVWLLGSGLLGLWGIRRRFKKG